MTKKRGGQPVKSAKRVKALALKSVEDGKSKSVRGGATGGGKVRVHDLNVTKRTDKSSADLF